MPQGTPTNNTETDRTDWTVHPDPAPPMTTVSVGPAAGSNADVLSRALGIAPDVLDGLPAEHERVPLGAAPLELSDQSCLADARLSAEQHHDRAFSGGFT